MPLKFVRTLPAALSLGAFLAFSPGAAPEAKAQAASPCLVAQAAQAALDRELLMIRTLAVDPQQIFGGDVGSCIDMGIFDSLDLSIAIPDAGGLLGALSGLLNPDAIIGKALEAARNKVCETVNERLADVVGKANSAMGDFRSTLNVDLQRVLNDGWLEVEF